MRKIIIILSIFTLLAGSCKTTASIVAQEKSIVGIWHFPKDRFLLEITETDMGKYGDELWEYKVVSKRKVSSIRDGKERFGNYKLSKGGNRLIIVDGGEKHFGERLTIQADKGLVGRYVTDDSGIYIEIIDEHNVLIGDDSTEESVAMKYIKLEQRILFVHGGYYNTGEIIDDGFIFKDGDGNEIGTHKKVQK